MFQRIIVFVALCMVGCVSFAQVGVNFRAGIGTMITDNEIFTAENGAHYGWRAAMFARIGASDTWFFDPGIAYEGYNIVASSEFDAFETDPKLRFLKAYINIATFLIQTDLFKMRLSGGGNISYLARIDDNPIYKLEDFNDATLGVNGGLGIDLWVLTFDLGYEHALTNFFANEDMSNRFWTFSAGFFF